MFEGSVILWFIVDLIVVLIAYGTLIFTRSKIPQVIGLLWISCGLVNVLVFGTLVPVLVLAGFKFLLGILWLCEGVLWRKDS